MRGCRHLVGSGTRPCSAVYRVQGVPRRRLANRVKCSNYDEAGMTLQEIKVKLVAAVESEDYKAAAYLRDVLAEKELDSKLAVEHANQQFYRAFQLGSMEDMRKIWGKGDHIQCIHPGQGCIAGYDMVLESWEAVFASFARGSLKIGLQDVRVYAGEEQAFVTCTEVVKTPTDSGMIMATNLFEKQQGKWVVVHHHGSVGRQ